MCLKERPMEEEYPLSNQVQLVHRLCPHHNVIQSFEVEQKDSLDEHLDVLTRKLAEKVSSCFIFSYIHYRFLYLHLNNVH